jgi:hypothetical protein
MIRLVYKSYLVYLLSKYTSPSNSDTYNLWDKSIYFSIQLKRPPYIYNFM